MPVIARLFGRLHNQIVLPLVLGAVLVALMATVIAIDIVSKPIEARVHSNLETSSRVAATRFEEEIAGVQRFTKVVSESRGVAQSVRSSDRRRLGPVAIPLKIALDVDFLAIVDRKGDVVMCVGSAHMPMESIRDTMLWRLGSLEMNTADIIQTRTGPAIASIAPTRDVRGVSGYVVLGQLVTPGFMRALQDRREVPMTLLDAKGDCVVATTLSTAEERRFVAAKRPLDVAMRVASTGRARSTSYSVGRAEYLASYRPLVLEGRTVGVVEAIQPTTDIVATQQGTTLLIAMWSIVAVLVLVGLGMYIARRVSQPIQSLAESARTVASGDLSPKIEVRGRGEIAELSSSFNSMTASLREQTAALTKRLVELYAFYDMSKALSTTLELDTLLHTVLDSALKVLRADSGYIMLMDRETHELVLRAHRGVDGDSDRPEEVSESIGRWVLQEGRPLLFGEGKYRDTAFPNAETAPKSAVCVPLKVKDSVIGVITVSNSGSDTSFTEENVRLLSTLAANAAVAIENAQLFMSLELAYVGTVKALAAAIDAKDSYTQGHSTQVAGYCLMLAEEIGLSDEEKKAVETAAYLHDIGKIGVRDEVLLKPGRLSLSEMNEIRHHSMISANILAPVPFPWQVTPIVRHHHERWDGSGYPGGLKGHEIPLLARVLAVADAFDAMTSKRPYRKKKTFQEAVDELKVCSGTHFDPELVGPFISALDKSGMSSLMHERSLRTPTPEQFDREEVRAIFITLANGLLASLRRLGGPRVAANVEAELNAAYDAKDFPFTFEQGYLAALWDSDRPLRAEVDMLVEALTMECTAMESRVGGGIVARFYADALDGLSSRFRALAARFGLDSAFVHESTQG